MNINTADELSSLRDRLVQVLSLRDAEQKLRDESYDPMKREGHKMALNRLHYRILGLQASIDKIVSKEVYS